jgi:fucose 4-O-acetylase-like acetyltransferase
MKQRLSWIDWAKVICIWLMICCHAGQKGLILDLSYQFHMPAFFIISGFLFHAKGIKKELKGFGIPIIFYGIICLCYRLLIIISKSDNIDVGEITTRCLLILKVSLKSLVVSSEISWFQGYWFVVTLMLIRLLMEWHIFVEYKYMIAALCVVWNSIEPYMNVSPLIMGFKPYHVISCLPFFVLGMVVKEKQIKLDTGRAEYKLIAASLFFVLTLIQRQIDLSIYCYGYSYIICFLNACLGSWLLFSTTSSLPQCNWIQTLATGTLLILGLHGILYGYVTSFFHKFLGLNGFYIPLFVGLIVLGLCFPLIMWLEKKQPLLLGKIH